MDIDKMIEQLSMPVSYLNGQDGSAGLGLSQDSIGLTYSSNNSSWMSESSCGCHSPRSSSISKSLLIFNNHCILPPLLCSSSRTEMQIYRRKAVEKEQKRRKKHSHNLLSKVENLLENADNCHARFPISSSHNNDNLVAMSKNEQQLESNCETSFCEHNVKHTSDQNEASYPSLTKPDDNETNSNTSEVDIDENDAYQLSLRKLLEKSMSMDNTSDQIHFPNTSKLVKNPAEKKVGGMQKSVNLILDNPTDDNESSCLHQKETKTSAAIATKKILENTKEITIDEATRIELDKTAEDLVASVLDAVKAELTHSKISLDASNDGCLVPLNDNESPLQSCSIHCPYYSPRTYKSSNSSPCKAARHIDKALQLLETELAFPHQQSQLKPSSNAMPKDGSKLSSPLNAGQVDQVFSDHPKIEIISVPQLSEVSPKKKLIGFTDCVSPTSGKASVSGIGSRTSPDSNLSPGRSGPETEDSTNRVRTGSFSTENPSFLLLSARTAHTIHSEDGEKSKSDVKRRLDMNSDSDESLLSSAITDISLRSINLAGKASMPDYCKLLEEQHRKEMEELRLHHQMQLRKYREKLLRDSPVPSDETSLFFEEEFSLTSQSEVSPEMHLKWCKLSALIKGHLTRKLLTSLPVQSTMQTIRDTSRTILSMRNEDKSSSTNMAAIQDATLMQRLFSQLKAAMFEFHSYFFELTIEEKMDVIARSRMAEAKSNMIKNINSPKVARLSAATLKSLQRKKDVRRSQEENKAADQKHKNLLIDRKRQQNKEVKSKISSIWKTGTSKKTSKSKLKSDTKSPNDQKNSYCQIQSPLGVSNRRNCRLGVGKR